jgi:histidinol dehydrogenase
VRVSRFDLESDRSEELRELAAGVRALTPPVPEVAEVVEEVLAAVRARGDAAVIELTRRFDSESASEELRVPPGRLEQALRDLEPAVRTGLETAMANVRAVSEAEPSGGVEVQLPQEQRVELRELPVRRVGAYVPGGRAPYPSSVVMCCVPARVAGVGELAVASPPRRDGEIDPVTLAACALCEVDEVYAMGGAQAIAAFAHGTESVEAVDVIVGPGSPYVQEAKRQVVGTVGVDGIEGPTELVVVADEEADPALVALDLAAQAEHGRESLLVLISPSEHLLQSVEAEVETLRVTRETVSDAPLALVLAPSVVASVLLANAIAPEHLELQCAGADRLVDAVDTSGCVFVGDGGAAFGDYVAGSNHVLPTGGAARFAGPLDVARFRRRQALVWLPPVAARSLAPFVSSIARAEGFPVHAESAQARGGLGGGQSGEH